MGRSARKRKTEGRKDREEEVELTDRGRASDLLSSRFLVSFSIIMTCNEAS